MVSVSCLCCCQPATAFCAARRQTRELSSSDMVTDILPREFPTVARGRRPIDQRLRHHRLSSCRSWIRRSRSSWRRPLSGSLCIQYLTHAIHLRSQCTLSVSYGSVKPVTACGVSLSTVGAQLHKKQWPRQLPFSSKLVTLVRLRPVIVRDLRRPGTIVHRLPRTWEAPTSILGDY